MLKGRLPTNRFVSLELSWVIIFCGMSLHSSNELR